MRPPLSPRGIFLTLCLTTLLGLATAPRSAAAAEAPKEETDPEVMGITVDKKTNTLYLTNFTDHGMDVKETYHTTLGLVTGDKEKEGDKKTPEGIYFFEEIRKPPRLDKKFGNMALTLNYPNPWDRFVGHTGSGIWFHATDTPSRLVKNFDSLGCVVVDNSQIASIVPQIKYRMSPIVIYDDFEKQKNERTPQRVANLKAFVHKWAESWSGKDLDTYISLYHPKFSLSGRNLAQYKAFKNQLNKQYKQIFVTVDHLMVFTHPKYDVAIFNQNYDSEFANGSHGRKTSGAKILYITHDDGQLKILSEQYRDTRL